jgi:hypothetical protein
MRLRLGGLLTRIGYGLFGRVDVVVFVFPGATVLRAGEARVVFVCPGAAVLFPRDATAEVVFVCPGAAVLLPRDPTAAVVFVCPVVALLAWEAPAPGVGFRPRTRTCCAGCTGFTARVANAAAGNAGRRSEVEGLRGSGSFTSGAGPLEARIT